MAVLRKTKQEVIAQIRSHEILEAARRIFASKGFAEATMDDIAEAAGLAKGTLYLYFPSKRDIYLKAMEEGILALEESTREVMETATGIEARLRAFIAIRVEYAEEHRNFFKIYLAEFGSVMHPVPLDRQLQQIYRRQAKALEHVLAEAVKWREIRNVSPATAAYAVQDLTKGLIVRRLMGWSKSDVGEDIQSIWEVIWRGIGR